MNSNCFVTTINLSLAAKLKSDLEQAGFELSKPAYTEFSGKSKTVSVTLYTSGKLMVQGKGAKEWVEFYLEPELLKSFEITNKTVDTTARIGIDESGKGDFFGPLCIAGVFASPETIQTLVKLGVKDSKQMNDRTIHDLAKKIKQETAHEVIRLNPAKYNELYEKFKNLNHLLGWGHATAIEALFQKTGCKKVIIDQFASEHVVENALKRKGVSLDLEQRHKGEEDVVVAAASILARDAFVWGLKNLEEEAGIPLPKGAGPQVPKTAKLLAQKFGKDGLARFVKTHFKTYDEL